ncbi:hypothetical protein F4804DRAFT_319562 [Jackrogersella minutella]|nr:hypothetical protein F4804DRAFT_319562 [Jackrogersella minutella]
MNHPRNWFFIKTSSLIQHPIHPNSFNAISSCVYHHFYQNFIMSQPTKSQVLQALSGYRNHIEDHNRRTLDWFVQFAETSECPDDLHLCKEEISLPDGRISCVCFHGHRRNAQLSTEL